MFKIRLIACAGKVLLYKLLNNEGESYILKLNQMCSNGHYN